MHAHPRKLLQSHYLSRTQIGLANHVALHRQSGSARAAYATISSTTIEGEARKNKEDKPPTKSPYPYPKHPNPTPYQIFHLPVGASQAQIKARYYELVRAHHPDSHHSARIGADLAHARFRTIKASYDFLSGKTLSPHPNSRPAPEPQNFDPYMHELARRRRAFYASQGRYQKYDENGQETGYTRPQYPDDGYNESGKKERIILALGVLSLLAGLFPSLPGTLISPVVPPSPPTSSASSSRESASTPSPRTGAASGTIPPAAAPTPAAATSASGFGFPFIDLDRGHRDAVSTLVQLRSERKSLGAERRDGVRQRVKEMNEAARAETEAETDPNAPSSEVAQASVDTDRAHGSEPTHLCQGVSVADIDDATVRAPAELRKTSSAREQNMEVGMEALAISSGKEGSGGSKTDETASKA